MSNALMFGGRHGAAPVVCHVGAWNGLAASAYQTWAFHRAEMTSFTESPFRLPTGDRVTMAHIETLPPQARAASRRLAIATRLLDPLLFQVAGKVSNNRIGLAVVVNARLDEKNGAHERSRLEAFLREQFRERDLDPLITIVPKSHAGGVHALKWAAVGLRKQLDVAIVGGLESFYDPDIIASLIDDRRLYDGDNLDSSIPGEGGGFFTLTTRAVARSLRWPVLLVLEAVTEAQDTSAGSFGAGLGLTEAVRPIADRLAKEGRKVSRWWSDMTNEHYRTHEFQMAYPRISDALADDARVEYLARYLGDLGAATLPTALAVSAEAMHRGDPGPSSALITLTSPTLDRGAVLLSTSK